MIKGFERAKIGMLLLFLALSLTLVLFYFSTNGYFDLMIPFNTIYFFPAAIFILAQVVRAYRLFFLTRSFENHFSKPVVVHFFSESFGNLLFPFFKEVYAFFVGGILFKKKIKLLKTLLWVRLVDILLILTLLFCFKNTILIISKFMLLSFAGYALVIVALLLALFLIRKDKSYLKFLSQKLGYTFIQTVWIWLLEITALSFFLNMSSGIFSLREVGFNLVLNFTPVDGLHYKWLYLIMCVGTVAVFLLEGFRYLSNDKSKSL